MYVDTHKHTSVRVHMEHGALCTHDVCHGTPCPLLATFAQGIVILGHCCVYHVDDVGDSDFKTIGLLLFCSKVQSRVDFIFSKCSL